MVARVAFDEAIEETGNIDYDRAAAILMEIKETENMLEEFCKPLREEFDKISPIIDAYFERVVGESGIIRKITRGNQAALRNGGGFLM